MDFDEHVEPGTEEYRYYSDLLGWELEDERINDL
jgi:hypothetical protein